VNLGSWFTVVTT